MRWTEGFIHLAMRRVLRDRGWKLIAGEFPGGTDHELYPLCVVDPRVARDSSPDPRRHSLGELIPDLVALKGRYLFVGEAKLGYDEGDKLKLEYLLGDRRQDFFLALTKFAKERGFPELLPVESLEFKPALVFLEGRKAPVPVGTLSYLRIADQQTGYFQGDLAIVGEECLQD
jgi:hypothetical protein